MRSCGDRGRQESEARAACLNDARAKYGASASLTLLTDPPSFRGDADQRNGVCARRILGACVDFKDELNVLGELT
ncbi:hypothetical protein Xen7305DRAFT_00000430 [Xenococcus sp. PCC 7305]|uniref:hypothetical protein n=1 Tax=Xenococcus sp. PCC 7305 TaxID=102125 RepID=UPI0002ABAA92|nr:hypothetical protein [Xenococcus sp. PCC 7305]ELS00343.1 hypothetical protein Xen7305DRAFT_00000430 [Xenococcus sp. PCC 7305]